MPSVFGRIPLQKETLLIEIQQKLQKVKELKEEKKKAVDEAVNMKNHNVQLMKWNDDFSDKLASMELQKTQKEVKVAQLQKEYKEEKEKTRKVDVDSEFEKDDKEKFEFLIEDREEKINELQDKYLNLKNTAVGLDFVKQMIQN